ncbi:MAG: amidase [Dehalococcoidia bacterium]|nr:amidase [Dehalococcoidia bacterium]
MTELHDLTVAEAARAIREREVSAEELMSALLAVCSELERHLNVWVTLDEDAALEAARLRDRELASEGPRGPLHGVPVGVKDIYYTQGVLTTACSKILADFVPDFDATAVSKLRQAGAVIMGKTVTTEFACGDPPPTRNPWNHAHTPGGSSSGSAVGVIAKMFPAALGSQTGGSVLRPAAYNGVVGLKPTFGRISRYGVVPVSASLDTMGHYGRTVEDTAMLLDAMSGYDPNDPGSVDAQIPNYHAASLAPQSAPRIGLVRTHFWEKATEETQEHADSIARQFAEAGAVVEDIELSPDPFDDMLWAHRILMSTEGADFHREWFVDRADDYSPKVRVMIEDGLQVSAVDYLKAKDVQAAFTRDVTEAMRPFDVVMTPSTPSSAPRDLSTTGDPMFQSPFTFGGFPTITLPSGFDSNAMPLGVQLGTPHWEEAKLLSVAAWAEGILD